MRLAEKISRYGRQNGLVAILEPNYRRNHPDLRDFIKKNGIEKYFRDFGPYARMEDIVESRAELYRLLSLHVWDPERLGFTPPVTVDEAEPDVAIAQEAPARGTPSRKRPLQTDLAKTVRAGLVPVDSVVSAPMPVVNIMER